MLATVTHVPITFAAPVALGVGGALSVLTVVITIIRRPAVSGLTRTLVLLGMALLCLGAAGPVWRRPSAGEVAVMVDLSPSTRTAEYRRRAMLEARIGQLLSGVPHRLYYFADGTAPANLISAAGTGDLPDLPADRTRYEPPTGAAVLLFSDGQFEMPPADAGGPPTYPVIDVGLEGPRDAAVVTLEAHGDSAAAEVRNSGPDRQLSLPGMTGTSPTTAPAGEYVVSRAVDPSAGAIAARLDSGDVWPENDALAAAIPPPPQAERWLVDGGAMAAPPGWRVMSPEALPTDSAAWLAPSVIVLNDIDGGRLSPDRQDRLRQYVRDLGGGLVILGGPHAFAAGGYPGSALESLSPLASTPPRPTTHWILLADSSGSMNGPAAVLGTTGASGAASMWHYASEAIVKALPLLPPDDRVSVGSFAEEVTWWSADRSARDTAALPLPSANAFPKGPTNLRPALEAVTREADSGIPNELLLLTDADADVGDPAVLAAAMKEKKVRLFLLALGEGRGLAALQQIANDTGGRLIHQGEAGKWAQAVEELMRSAEPSLLETTPVAVRFIGDLSTLAGMEVSPWNRTWLKAAAVAVASADFAGQGVIPAAQWAVGQGRVLSAGFKISGDRLIRLARLIERPPRDPRFSVSWETGPNLRVTVDALAGADASGGEVYLNGKRLTLEISASGTAAASGTVQSLPIGQTAPGRYELTAAAPRTPSLATVRLSDGTGASRTLDRFALAGRYAPEFDAIGDNFANLRELAMRTGGAIVPPQQVTPIDFHWPLNDVPLGSWLATAGAAFIALGLVAWRAS
jgi:hypothetical protein